MCEPKTETITLGEEEFCIHTWNQANKDTKDTGVAVVVIFHGFLAHGVYPTVKYAAELLAGCGHIVVAPDFRGHGQSPGLRGYLPSVEGLLQDAGNVVQYAMEQYGRLSATDTPRKLFMLGSSMGGAIALHVAQQLRDNAKQSETYTGEAKPILASGLILLAPMLQLSVGDVAATALSGLAQVIPTWQVIPSSSTSAELQYRDATKRQECEDDPQAIRGSHIRVASAYSCVTLARQTAPLFDKVQEAFFLGIADEDVVVKNQGSLDLFEKAPSTTDKTMKRYPALHGLLCEPMPLLQTIHDDVLQWVTKQCQA